MLEDVGDPGVLGWWRVEVGERSGVERARSCQSRAEAAKERWTAAAPDCLRPADDRALAFGGR